MFKSTFVSFFLVVSLQFAASNVLAESQAIYLPDRVLCQYRHFAAVYLQQFDEKCANGWREVARYRTPSDIDQLLQFNLDSAQRRGARFSAKRCFRKSATAEFSSMNQPIESEATISVSVSCELENPGDPRAADPYVLVDSGFSLSSHAIEKGATCTETAAAPPVRNPDGSYTYSASSVVCSSPPFSIFSNGANQTLVQDKLITADFEGESSAIVGRTLTSEVNLDGLRILAREKGADEARAVLEAEVYCCPLGF